MTNNNTRTDVDAADAAREAAREASIAMFAIDPRPAPRYRHFVLSSGEVVSEPIEG